MTATGAPTAGIDFGQGISAAKPHDALRAAAAAINSLRETDGTDTLGVVIGDQLTSEEMFLLKFMAEEIIGTEYIYAPNAEKGGLGDVWGFDASTATVADVEAAGGVIDGGGNVKALVLHGENLLTGILSHKRTHCP